MSGRGWALEKETAEHAKGRGDRIGLLCGTRRGSVFSAVRFLDNQTVLAFPIRRRVAPSPQSRATKLVIRVRDAKTGTGQGVDKNRPERKWVSEFTKRVAQLRTNRNDV